MEIQKNKLMFGLIRSAIGGSLLSDGEKAIFSEETIREVFELASSHDVLHLVMSGLEKNGLTTDSLREPVKKMIIGTMLRYEKVNFEYENLCRIFENEKIPFVPLKGSVIRRYYEEPWMRTSCDIDILVKKEDLDRAIDCLITNYGFESEGRSTHDIMLYSPKKVLVEIHFDLVEEDRGFNTITTLRHVWENVFLKEGYQYLYEMNDGFFYFYHIAHMAKHFETGGCGIKPFIDIEILDHIDSKNQQKRDALLKKGGLLKFARIAEKLSRVWFCGEETDEMCLTLEEYVLTGGNHGSRENRVALNQTKEGGKIGYIFSRIFVGYDRLCRYYPVLEKHKWLMPFMQVRRWFKLLRPRVRKMAKDELSATTMVENSKSDKLNYFLKEIGL